LVIGAAVVVVAAPYYTTETLSTWQGFDHRYRFFNQPQCQSFFNDIIQNPSFTCGQANGTSAATLSAAGTSLSVTLLEAKAAPDYTCKTRKFPAKVIPVFGTVFYDIALGIQGQSKEIFQVGLGALCILLDQATFATPAIGAPLQYLASLGAARTVDSPAIYHFSAEPASPCQALFTWMALNDQIFVCTAPTAKDVEAYVSLGNTTLGFSYAGSIAPIHCVDKHGQNGADVDLISVRSFMTATRNHDQSLFQSSLGEVCGQLEPLFIREARAAWAPKIVTVTPTP